MIYGLLGQENIWSRFNYLKFGNLRVKKKNQNTGKVDVLHIAKQQICFDIFIAKNITMQLKTFLCSLKLSFLRVSLP